VRQPDLREQLKSLEVFESGVSIYKWESSVAGDYPRLIVESKSCLLLWGHEILEAASRASKQIAVKKLSGADRVLAEWMDGTVEIMTDNETRTFKPGGGWREYWKSLDEWPREIDEKGGAAK
jgi:hypothetical protein